MLEIKEELCTKSFTVPIQFVSNWDLKAITVGLLKKDSILKWQANEYLIV